MRSGDASHLKRAGPPPLPLVSLPTRVAAYNVALILHAAKEARACRCIYNGGKRLATRRGNGGVGAFVSNHRRGQFDWQVKGEGGGERLIPWAGEIPGGLRL